MPINSGVHKLWCNYVMEYYTASVSKLLASLGHTERRRVVLDHTLNTLRHIITKKSHVLSKFMISALAGVAQWIECWPASQRVPVPFLIMAHAWVVVQVPDWGPARGN